MSHAEPRKKRQENPFYQISRCPRFHTARGQNFREGQVRLGIELVDGPGMLYLGTLSNRPPRKQTALPVLGGLHHHYSRI